MKRIALTLGLTLLLVLAGCQAATTPTPAAQAPTAAPASATPLRPPSATPAPSATPVRPPSATPLPPTATATASATASATATAEPSLALRIVDAETGEPIPAGSGLLWNPAAELALDLADAEDGWLQLTGLAPADYTLTLTATGYALTTLPLTAGPGLTELEIELPPQPMALVTSASANLRGGPGTVYGIVGRAVEGDSLPVTGRNADGSWLLVLDADGEPAWVAASLVELSGDPQALAAATPPPTPDAPIAPAAPTSSGGATGAPPTGPNLLANPGFEDTSVWIRWGIPAGEIGRITDPAEIRSGAGAAQVGGDELRPLFQHVYNVTPGETYRFGVWVHLFTLTPDTFYPEDPGRRTSASICINTIGVEDIREPHSVCSPRVEPWNGWFYLTVDAVAESDKIAVLLLHHQHHDWNVTRYIRNHATYDDAYLGLAPVSATPTPLPPQAPGPLAPAAFDGQALLANMTAAYSTMEHIGGLLDSSIGGTPEVCPALLQDMNALKAYQPYHSIPAEWQGIYNEYIASIGLLMDAADPLYFFCLQDPDGKAADAFYTNARQGVFNALPRLAPAIEAARNLLNS